MRRYIIALIAIIVVGGGGYVAYQQLTVESTTDVAAAQTVDEPVINDTGRVSAEGQIVPLRDAAVSFVTGGRVAEILVEEGATVQAGDLLLRLEATDLEINVRQAEAAYQQTEASLVSAQAQLETAQVGVANAELGVAAAQAQLALLTAAPSPEEIASAEANVASAAAGINQAAGNRDAALTGATQSQILAAQANVAAAAEQAQQARELHESLIHNEILGEAEEQARFASENAQAQLAAAQATLDELLAGPNTAEQVAANGGVSAAIAQRDASQAQLDLLLAGPKAEQIAASEIAVEQAEAAVLEAETRVAQTEAAVAQAEAGVAQALASLEAAQAALDQMTLTAPFAGTVAAMDIELGEIVSAGQPVVTLADLTTWQVETTDLTELDVVELAEGHPVTVQIDALPDAELAGTVTKIDAVSTLSQGDVVYAVTIQLEDTADLPLRWGMTVFVDVDVE